MSICSISTFISEKLFNPANTPKLIGAGLSSYKAIRFASVCSSGWKLAQDIKENDSQEWDAFEQTLGTVAAISLFYFSTLLLEKESIRLVDSIKGYFPETTQYLDFKEPPFLYTALGSCTVFTYNVSNQRKTLFERAVSLSPIICGALVFILLAKEGQRNLSIYNRNWFPHLVPLRIRMVWTVCVVALLAISVFSVMAAAEEVFRYR